MLSECEIPSFHPVDAARSGSALRAVVAIPACNEAERIGACLRALGRQGDVGATSVGIVLFLNNCTDGTAHEVAAHRALVPFAIRVIERRFAGANAGWARREAMEAAAAWLEEAGAADGVILTTDADSRVAPDWIARNLAALSKEVDAVAGRIALDADDASRLPAALHARGALEGAYETLLTELAARIDPEPHNPWPCHWTTSGATLAVRSATYRAVGGMPALALGEDRAFVARLLAHDARVRHDPDILVVTSGRLEGRAPGGAADTMKLRCEEPESPCDPRLEPLARAVFRCLWRRRVRGLLASGNLGRTALWAPWLAIPRDKALAIAGLGTVGQVLAAVEAASPRLRFRPLSPHGLPVRIALARALLAAMRSGRGLDRLFRKARTPSRIVAPRRGTSPSRAGAVVPGGVRDPAAEGVGHA